jgi:hypothetical protein
VMTNTGTSTMHIASISLTSSDFTQTNNCGATLAPGASCSFQVAFKPGRWGGYGEYLQLTGDMFGGAGSVLLGAEGEDFSLAVPTGKSASATVSRGQTATYTVNVAPSGGTANYNTTFACAGAPQEATCTVSPSSLTLGPTGSENVTVTVTTTAPSAVLFPAGPRFPAGIGSWPPLLSLIFLFLLATHVAVSCKPRRTQEHQLPPFVRRPNSTNPLPILYGLACVAFGVFLLAFAPSCGGGGASGNGGGGGGPTNPGTPSGNYTLTLTATATQGSATLSHSTSLSLTVQ